MFTQIVLPLVFMALAVLALRKELLSEKERKQEYSKGFNDGFELGRVGTPAKDKNV